MLQVERSERLKEAKYIARIVQKRMKTIHAFPHRFAYDAELLAMLYVEIEYMERENVYGSE